MLWMVDSLSLDYDFKKSLIYYISVVEIADHFTPGSFLLLFQSTIAFYKIAAFHTPLLPPPEWSYRISIEKMSDSYDIIECDCS